MAARLKVFRAHLGFYDTVVAAPSQKAALAAWGARQNLFAIGTAALTRDPEASAAALAHPGTVLKRAFGSRGVYSANPAPPAAPKPPKRRKAEIADAERREKQRARMRAAKRALEKLESEEHDALAALARRRDRLSAEEDRIRARFAGKRSAIAKS